MSIHPVNRSQEIIHDLCIRGPVCAKRIARRLGKAHDYVGDICRRDRVDFLHVFNAILQELVPLARTDRHAFVTLSSQVIAPLFEGTAWYAQFIEVPDAADMPRLCAQAGSLLEELGGALRHLGRIESDGAVTAEDDPDIAMFMDRAGQLTARLQTIIGELHRRRAAKETPR